jgi:5-methyltetrahydropteroyltriglutamate--homocysteine methyltransferase
LRRSRQRHEPATRCLTTVDRYTTKRGELENADELIARIEEASRYVDRDRLALSPQCGFGTSIIGNKLTQEQQGAKLRLVCEVAERVWG